MQSNLVFADKLHKKNKRTKEEIRVRAIAETERDNWIQAGMDLCLELKTMRWQAHNAEMEG